MMFSMQMGKRRIMLYAVPTVVLAISTAYLLLPPQLKLYYVIDDAHRSEVEPQGTWSSMTCPQCGSQLEGIVIDPDEPQMLDEAWRSAYYCKQEDIFWVADMPGFYFAGWYGPFNAYWTIINAVTIIIIVISGVTVILLYIRDKGLMKNIRQDKMNS